MNKIVWISLMCHVNSEWVIIHERHVNLIDSKLKMWTITFGCILDISPFVHVINYVVSLDTKFQKFLFRWVDWLCGPRLLSTKQLLCKSSLPRLTRSSWPHSAKPTALLSAHFKTLLWSNQIPHWQGQYSCHSSRDLIWQQVYVYLFYSLMNSGHVFP